MAFSSEEVELLLQIARDGTLARTFKERVDVLADAISALIPNTSMDSFVVDPLSRAGPSQAHLIFRNRDPAMLLDYATHYIREDPMAVVFPKADGNAHLMSDFMRDRDYGKTEFSTDFLPQIGVRHVIAVSHRMPGGSLLSFALHREKGLRDFTAREREIMRLASPDIARAAFGALVNEKVLALASGPAPRSDLAMGAIVFDALGDVVSADPGARALVARLANGDRFPADDFVTEARHVAASPTPGLVVERMFKMKDGGWLLARFSQMRGHHSRGAVCVLEVLKPGSDEYVSAILDRARLTPREREVAALAIRGLGNRQIGLRIGISTVMVGIYLTRIYAKVGVTGRYELTALLLGGKTGTAEA